MATQRQIRGKYLKRRSKQTFFVFLLVSIMGQFFCRVASADQPPNFIFIMTDDQDTYSINAYRESEPCETTESGDFYSIDTPNIDRLADEGMIFHQARLMGATSQAVCAPSRTSIMTGLNSWDAWNLYSYSSTHPFDASNTFAGVFNQAGYDTFRTCKSGNTYNLANNEFDNALANSATKTGAADGTGSDWHVDQVVNHLEARRVSGTTDPFLIYLGFSHPHDPRNGRDGTSVGQGTTNLLARYGATNPVGSEPASDTWPGTITLNPNAPPLPANWLGCTPATYPAHPFVIGDIYVRDETKVQGVYKWRTEAVIRNEVGREMACVDWIDQQIGRVLEKLEDPDGNGNKSDSLLDNTYIVFTSDHGIALGRHGLQGKQNLYEHTWRVPYIVRGPGIASGSKTDALIYLHDTFPTLCELAGIAPPSTIEAEDGKSFKLVLTGQTNTVRNILYGLYAEPRVAPYGVNIQNLPGIRAITDGRWKLIVYDLTIADTGLHTKKTQLFDLQSNPFELLPEHGVPNLADNPLYSLIRQDLEEKLMQQRIFNEDPFIYLADRILYRFEEGLPGQQAGPIEDALPRGLDGVAASGTGGTLPVYSTAVFATMDAVVGETNSLALDFEQNNQNYIEVPHNLDFNFGSYEFSHNIVLDIGPTPFTIEAWVKLETLPSGVNTASCMPVVMKKAPGVGDAGLDYLFLAAAGNYGATANFSNLALITANEQVISSLSIPDTTTWHHISVAFDPDLELVRFTMDDQTEVHSGITGLRDANTGPLVIGAHFNSSDVVDSSFDGLMDEVSIAHWYVPTGLLQPLHELPAPVVSPLHAPAITPDGMEINFSSDQQFLYDVESKESLTNLDWQVEQSLMLGEGGTNTVILPTDQTTKFYRIQTSGPRRP